jgi:hypothetical protein
MRSVLFFLSLFVFADCFAQPANDEPCNATLLPIIENADGCNPVLYTVTGATYSNVPGTSSCGVLPDVWLRFNTPDERMKLRITGSNIYISTYTYSSCSANLTDALPCLDSATLASLMNGNVVFEPGVNQLIRVSSINGSANFSFRICATLLRPAANQRVGINTKLPTANLDVAGVAVFRDTLSVQNTFRLYKGNATNNYVLTSDVNGYANWAPPPGNYWLANGNKIYNANAGNVGIGTSAPSGPLSFANVLGSKIVLWGDGSTANYGMGIQNSLLQIYSDGAASDIAFGHGTSNTFTESMRIKGNGNVGIGDANPGFLLSVNGTDAAIMRINGGTGMYVTLAENNINRGYIGSYEGNPEDIQLGTHSQNTTGSVHLSTGNISRLTVSPAGNVGIGNTSPTRPLSFPPSLGEKIVLYPGSTGEVGIGVYGGELRLHCDIPAGKVSFGTQDNAGNFDQTALAQRNGVYAFSVIGSLWVNGTTYASDERFKKNITAISSPLEKLLRLNGVEYEMRTESFPQNHFTPGRQIGLIAQNVEKVIPEAVSEKDGYKGVDYARLVPLLIESIKELKKEIEALKAQVNH